METENPEVPSAVSEEESEKIIENVSPGFTIPTIRYESGEYIKEDMVWGLIPVFDRSERPDHYRLFNKRIESFSNDNQYFNRLLQTKRCVVFFDGFYEWKVIAGKKQPHYVQLEGEAIPMAGIYEDFYHDHSNPYLANVSKSFSVLTGIPCKSFSSVHNRQPVFLTDEQVRSWLNPETPIFSLLDILKKNPENEELEMNHKINFFPVSDRMTSPKYQKEDCSKPISLGKSVSDFFSRPTTLRKAPDTVSEDKVAIAIPVGEKRKHVDAIDLTNDEDPDSNHPKKASNTSPSQRQQISRTKNKRELPSPLKSDKSGGILNWLSPPRK